MQILHFSDLHIGVENYGRPANELDLEKLPDYFAPEVDRKEYLGLSTRLLDFLTVFDYIIKFAIEEQVDLVLLSGDAYKSRDPSQTHQREFARRIAKLTSHSIPVFLLLGNHDIPHAIGRATALEIFSTLKIPFVCIGDQLKTYHMQTKSGPLQIVALPWIRRGSLLVLEEHQGRSITEITSNVESELTRRLAYEAKNLNPSTPTILSAHVSVAGSTTSSERSMMLGRDYVLQRSSIALPEFDYVALGHIHKHQSLGESPPIIYPGSPQRVDFSEEKDNKGFCLVTIDPQKAPGQRATWTFCPVLARPFITINCEISKTEVNPTKAVLQEIGKKELEDAVVRLHIKLTKDQVSKLDDGLIHDALTNAHVIAPITREIIQERRPRLGVGAKGLAPEVALEWFLQNQPGIDTKTLNRALELGKTLIQYEQNLES